MSLINYTYFTGELNIPGTNKTDVQERLSLFINKYEEKFLTDLLGYKLYSDFVTGLQQNPIADKWTKLLFGGEYQYSGRLTKWKGLINLPTGVTATIDNAGTLEMVVGRGQTNDPAVNATSVTIPASFSNVPVVLERRGFGQMLSSEFSIVADVLSLTGGSSFNSGETFFLKKNATMGITASVQNVATSIIANYVYYWWLRDNVSSTTDVGEVVSNMDNSTVISPARKMTRAWNEMVDEVWKLVSFLDANVTDYPNWSWYGDTDGTYWMNYNYARIKDVFCPINTFNL